MKVKLEIVINYDMNGCSFEQVRDMLYSAAEHLSDNGLLSGHLDAEVNECTHSVVQLEDCNEQI